jgi:phenylalanine-4-hydroxylase
MPASTRAGRTGADSMTIPDHLAPYVTDDRWDSYTERDHEVWSRLAETLCDQLCGRAIAPLLDGLATLRLTGRRIPRLSDTNALLRAHGWMVVAVNGILPSRIWIDFVSRRIMPVVAKIRTAENLRYSPTPDIFHDLFGHTALLVHEGFASILQQYACVYAEVVPLTVDPTFPYVKQLSEAKVDERKNRRLIAELTARLEAISTETAYSAGPDRTITKRLAGFGWWVTEYGLLGTPDRAKIYGASLCSSLDESQQCLTSAYERLPLTLETLDRAYDATSRQTALYVAESFSDVAELIAQLQCEALSSKVA